MNAAERAAAVAALDAMRANRPLRPPPLPATVDTRTAGALALAADRRAGVLGREFER